MMVFGALAEALDRLEAPFVVGGSLASSVRGLPRSTVDVDLIVRISVKQLEELAENLGAAWYIDVEEARDSLRMGRAFNILHHATGLKFDLFPADAAFEKSELGRATMEKLVVEGEEIECPVATAEDILLAKLRWYLDGGGVSDRQWSDIVGIVQTNDLDQEYVRSWAKRLDVEPLFDKALTDSRL